MTDPTDTRIVLVRHGESFANRDGFLGGHRSCTGLSPDGRAQVEALRDRLERTGELRDAVALYASVLPRAIETAEIIAPALGGHEVVTRCELCEVHTGDEVDGMTWEELRDRRTDDVPAHPTYGAWAPGAESWAEFVGRTGRALWELAAAHEGETVVAACHGGTVEASLVAFGHLPLRRPFAVHVVNASITEWTRAQGVEEWTLRRFNDAAHLA